MIVVARWAGQRRTNGPRARTSPARFHPYLTLAVRSRKLPETATLITQTGHEFAWALLKRSLANLVKRSLSELTALA